MKTFGYFIQLAEVKCTVCSSYWRKSLHSTQQCAATDQPKVFLCLTPLDSAPTPNHKHSPLKACAPTLTQAALAFPVPSQIHHLSNRSKRSLPPLSNYRSFYPHCLSIPHLMLDILFTALVFAVPSGKIILSTSSLTATSSLTQYHSSFPLTNLNTYPQNVPERVFYSTNLTFHSNPDCFRIPRS